MSERRHAAISGWLWLTMCCACVHSGCTNAARTDNAGSETAAPQPSARTQTGAAAAASSDGSAGNPTGASDKSSASAAAASNTSAAAMNGKSDAGTAAANSDAGTTAANSDAGTAAASTPQAGSGGQASERKELCSGCPEETRPAMDMTIHLHHIHLNVHNSDTSAQFYEKHFQAKPILLNSTTEALQITPTLLLLDERSTAPNGNLPTSLQHIGWGTEDTAAWYESAHAQGIEPDTRGFSLFNTNETPTIGDPGSGAIIALSGAVPACFPVPDVASYMYVLGPDQERIEVWSGAEGRVNHVHFTTADLAATSTWFQTFLDLPSATPLLSYQFFLDDILFFFEPIGAAADYENTDDHTLAHVAFAVTSLAAWRTRVAELNIEVVAEPAAAHGWSSFFVRGPDGLLIELVEAAKNPELCPP